MSAEAAADGAPAPLIDWTWRNPKGTGGFRMVVYPGRRSVIYADGKGSIAGARAIIEHVERSVRELGVKEPYRTLVAMEGVHSSPIRGQYILGKGMFKQRHTVERLAVVGARAWERKLATAVVKLSGLGSKVRFFGDHDAAHAYLEWTPPPPPEP